MWDNLPSPSRPSVLTGSILDRWAPARAAMLAAAGKRVWEPTPQMPALIIIIDECAELAEAVPDATADSDSIGRRGRPSRSRSSPLPSAPRRRPWAPGGQEGERP